MRLLAAMTLMLTTAACAGPAGGPSPSGGVASYDALKNARAACLAKGGELTQIPGSTGKRIADFTCKRK